MAPPAGVGRWRICSMVSRPGPAPACQLVAGRPVGVLEHLAHHVGGHLRVVHVQHAHGQVCAWRRRCRGSPGRRHQRRGSTPRCARRRCSCRCSRCRAPGRPSAWRPSPGPCCVTMRASVSAVIARSPARYSFSAASARIVLHGLGHRLGDALVPRQAGPALADPPRASSLMVAVILSSMVRSLASRSAGRLPRPARFAAQFGFMKRYP